MVCTLLPFQFLHYAAVQFIPSLKVHFIPPPQTRNGHTKKGTGSLIRLLGGTTAKWLQIGAALTFLSNTPSLISPPTHRPPSRRDCRSSNGYGPLGTKMSNRSQTYPEEWWSMLGDVLFPVRAFRVNHFHK